MLAVVKENLRITTTALDTDLQDDIDAALMDLQRVGIDVTDQSQPLIIKAVKLYCRWQQDYMGKGEQYCKAYTGLMQALSLAGDYIAES
ncbi:phage head-tail connector protein [Syntrophomonas erecta subsp. sporosyntropha]